MIPEIYIKCYGCSKRKNAESDSVLLNIEMMNQMFDEDDLLVELLPVDAVGRIKTYNNVSLSLSTCFICNNQNITPLIKNDWTWYWWRNKFILDNQGDFISVLEIKLR